MSKKKKEEKGLSEIVEKAGRRAEKKGRVCLMTNQVHCSIPG